MRVSIILPTYNEAAAIGPNVLHISEVLEIAKIPYEILVVDDDSPDGTAEVVRKISEKNKNVKVIVRKNNHGLGLSIGEGVRRASGDIVVGMDADGNHDPGDLPYLINSLKDPYKLVVASRFVGQGGMKGWRMIPTFLFNAMFKLFSFPIWDNTSGYYSIAKTDLEKIGVDKIYYGYGDYHLRLVYYANQLGFRIKEVPTRYQARLGGASKSRLGKMAIDYTKEAWRLRTST